MKNIKLKLVFTSIVFFIILLMSKNTYAASSQISVSPSNPKVGDTITVTISANAASWNVSLSASGPIALNGTNSFSNATEEGENENVTIGTVKYTATGAGTANFSLTGQLVNSDYSANSATGSASVTVTAQTQQPPVQSNPTPNTTQSKPSPVALTFSNTNETVYATDNYVTVRSNHTTSSKPLGQLTKGESITKTGESTGTADGFKWSRVTYKGQTAYIASNFLTTTKPDTPSSVPTPETQKSNDSTLKNLSITAVQISPEFNSSVTEYVANINDDVNEVEVIAEVNNENASYEVTGNTELQDGENIVIVTVTAEDGSSTNYQIKVIKGEQDLQLSTLIIKGINSAGEEVIVELNPEFDGQTLEYKIDLKEFLKSITIEAIPNNVNAIVEGAGELEIAVGENKYTITLKLQKEDGEEEIIEYSITINNPEQVVTNNEMNETMKNMIKIGCAVAIALCAIGIIAAIIHFKKQNREDAVGEYVDYSYLSKNIKDDNNSEKDVEKANNDYNSYSSENNSNYDNSDSSYSNSDNYDNKDNYDNSNNYDNRDAYDDRDNKGRKKGKHF